MLWDRIGSEEKGDWGQVGRSVACERKGETLQITSLASVPVANSPVQVVEKGQHVKAQFDGRLLGVVAEIVVIKHFRWIVNPRLDHGGAVEVSGW